jgi:hypothetical protein
MPKEILTRKTVQKFRTDFAAGQIDKLHPERVGQRSQDVLFGSHSTLDSGAINSAGTGFRDLELFNLVPRQHSILHKQRCNVHHCSRL